MGESDYSFSLTTFSPTGRLVQIEYALQAVTAGATALGIKGELTFSYRKCFVIMLVSIVPSAKDEESTKSCD